MNSQSDADFFLWRGQGYLLETFGGCGGGLVRLPLRRKNTKKSATFCLLSLFLFLSCDSDAKGGTETKARGHEGQGGRPGTKQVYKIK